MQENQPTSGFQPSNPVIGSPSEDASVFPGQQSYPDTCAIRCQEFILEQFTGTDYPEDALIQECLDNGWYVPGQGTMPYNTGNLLEAHGIPVTRYESANAFNLTAELAQGHKVIVGVDSSELAEGNSILDEIREYFGFQGADHAVVVSGIDTSNPDDIRVIVSDPGTGTAAASYPLDDFIAAWQDSNFVMVATQQPAPQWLPEMANFNYELGHIPQVGNLPFADFVAMEQTSDWINQVFPAQGPDLPQPQSGTPSDKYEWPASIGPELAAQFDQTNKVLAEAQTFIDSMPQHASADSAGAIPLDTAGLDAASMANLRFANNLFAPIQALDDRLEKIKSGNYTEEDLQKWNAQDAAQAAHVNVLSVMNASNQISNSVTKSHHDMLDHKTAHNERIAADESMSDARDHASKHDFDKAQSDLEEAKYHQDQADYYDPDK